MHTTDMEALASASMEQIEAMGLESASAGGEGAGAEGGISAGAAGTDGGEQDVDAGATDGATDEGGQGEEGVGGVATKSGKGAPIPYAVLKETRQELAKTTQELAKTTQELEQLRQAATATSLPENHAEQMEATKAELADLGRQFEEGDLTWEDYHGKLIELEQRKESLLAAKIRADYAQELSQATTAAEESATDTMADSWGEAVEGFLAGKPDGVDYLSDQEAFEDLDTIVKMLGNNPANEQRDFNWFLQTAHTMTMAKRGIVPVQADGSDGGHGERPFHTLGDIPGGVAPGGNEAEQITALGGAALTNRFLNDPSQIDKVLSSLG